MKQPKTECGKPTTDISRLCPSVASQEDRNSALRDREPVVPCGSGKGSIHHGLDFLPDRIVRGVLRQRRLTASNFMLKELCAHRTCHESYDLVKAWLTFVHGRTLCGKLAFMSNGDISTLKQSAILAMAALELE